MGEEEKHGSLPTLKFPFTPSPLPHSPEHPLHTLASVPFKWEEQPGKPRPCTDIVPIPGPARIILEPPPCRMMDPNTSKVTKIPSPTTVLEGPYSVGRARFSSFRLFRESFDGDVSSVDALISNGGCQKRKGFLGFKGGGKKEADEGSLGCSSPPTGCEEEVRMRMGRNGSFSSRSQPTSLRICATLYERLKHVWTSTRKSKKGLKVLEDV